MFFGYNFNILLHLFVVSFLQVMAAKEAEENIEVLPLHHKMNDLTKLPWNIYCRFQKNEHNCGQTALRYYYDARLKSCLPFQYGNCKHTYNKFNKLPECREQCEDEALPPLPNVTLNVYCRFQPEFGNCNSYFPMWYFDISEMTCRGFSFSGCGGNTNRFDTFSDCLTACYTMVRQ